ncbi:MAG: XdhC family protein, partial [Proteobacteria bacterium]|nr:XdhC family protein [Pseudomonadota bacterium]
MTNNAIPAPVGGLRGLLDALWRSHSRNDAAVLGIVVATEGSTYQKPGALVLLDDKGLRHGAISGGCLEPALEQAALTVRESGCAAIVALDTRSDEDALFGSGIGCRGLVRVLLLPLPPHAPLARALFTALDRHDDL